MGKRIAALITVGVLLACVLITFIMAFTGSPNFLGMLMVTMILPVFVWLILFFFQKKKDDSSET